MSFKYGALLFLLMNTSLSHAQGDQLFIDPTSKWNQFEHQVEELKKRERREGLAYIFSGGLLLVGGIVGYQNAVGPVEKVAFSLTQSLAIGAVGFGIFQYHHGSEDRSFLALVNDSKSLALQQKEDLLNSYFAIKAEKERRMRWVRMASHGLIALANLYQASREQDHNVRDLLYVVGGLNGLAFVSIAF